ncbi:MAG: M23 family metallopeptidase [Beutenbergiaceae bacterium]
MNRISTAAGVLVMAAALALGALAPMAPDTAEEGDQPTTATSAGTTYASPVPGEVIAVFDGPSAPWAAGHRGVDLYGAVGEPVLAAADGIVAFAGVVVDRGVISIDHADGVRTSYEPVAATVRQGDRVSLGQAIGTITTGSHCPESGCLHWGARLGRTYIDPLSLLNPTVIRLYPPLP